MSDLSDIVVDVLRSREWLELYYSRYFEVEE